MNKRTCPNCGGRSYSSYSGSNWDCPYCGRNMDDVPNELNETVRDSPDGKTILFNENTEGVGTES